MKDGVLSYFTGTTFGNVVAKGDYDAMERASAEVAVLGRGLFLYFNDVYNLSQHRGLGPGGGQPPIDRMEERFLKNGIAEVPSVDRIRVIFGVDVLAPVTREGVCIAGNRYYSGRLAGFFRDKDQGKVGKRKRYRIKVDPCDLGRISIFFEGAWHTLEGPAIMRGVGLTAWLDQCRYLARRYGMQAKVHADIVARAILMLERMGTEARLKAQVQDMNYDSDEVAKAVSKVRLRVKEQETPAVEGAMLAFDSSSKAGSFDTAGDDPEAHDDAILAFPDEYDDSDPRAKPDDLTGIDGDDVDRDGEPVEHEEAPGIPDPEDQDGTPAFEEADDDAPTLQPAAAAAGIQFIKPPIRKG